jgi:hypothetical protein
MTDHSKEICEELLTRRESFLVCLLDHKTGSVSAPNIVTRSCNHCCNGNATTRRLFNVDPHLAVNNVKACNFAMQMEPWFLLVLLSINKTIRTALNLSALLSDIFVRQ